MKSNLTIYIYADEGTSIHSIKHTIKTFKQLQSLPIQTIKAKQLHQGDWKRFCKCLIMPGGKDRPYHEKLKGSANQHIIEYIQNGGSYLGICAGAYYASSEVEFAKGSSIEVHEKRQLQFYPEKAIGPLYPSHPFSYTKETGALAAKINYNQEPLYVYYNGGCSFINAHNHRHINVLATYVAHDMPAIILCKVGKGIAILSGVHIEYCPKEITEELIKHQILHTNTLRQKLVKDLMQKLNLSTEF